MTTAKFNIWHIPHPIPRAIVAWLLMLVAAFAILAALPLALAWCIVAGGLREFGAFWRGLTYGWGNTPSSWWRAASGKEAV